MTTPPDPLDPDEQPAPTAQCGTTNCPFCKQTNQPLEQGDYE